MYNGQKGTKGMDQDQMTKTHKVSVFNDEFRDLAKGGGMNETLKAFLTDGTVSVKQLFANACGFPQVNFEVNSPARCVQYFECHDGLTLHDVIAHNMQYDLSNELHLSELYARLRLAHTLLLTSQGIAFMQAGQENARTKPIDSLRERDTYDILGQFVKNSYKASDTINHFSWTLDTNREALNEFVQVLIALRKMFPHFRLHTKELVENSIHFLEQSSDLLLVYNINLKSQGIDEICYLVFNGRKTISSVELDVDFSKAQFYVLGDKASLTPFACSESDYNGNKFEMAPLSAMLFFVH